jgi:signal transduction histidine kinase
MNLSAAIAIAAGAVAAYVGLMARRFARAPGWGEQRWFSLIAFCASAYAAGNVATSLGWSDETVVRLSSLQLASALAQAWVWFQYVDAYVGRHPGRGERRVVGLLLLLAAGSLLPGLAYDGTVTSHAVPGLSLTYRDAVPTAAGAVLFGLAVAASLVVFARLVAAWRRGLAQAALHAVSFGALLASGVNDGLVASGLVHGVYLLDVGFVLPLAVMAFSFTQRFVADSQALRALRDRLEALVEARTGELIETQEALHQSEKLASLGQFAAGVAHEVNNPAAVVTSNLAYLEQALAAGTPPADAHDSTVEALAAMQRINGLVRRLVDAGRLAAVPMAGGTASIRAVVEQSFDDARAWSGERVAFRLEGAPDLHVGLRPEVLAQVLTALLYNAAEAIPPGRAGQVSVAAWAAEDDRIRLTVTDDGAGMSPEVLRRAFEPFFTTKGEGQGSGLGLPVARALIESLGGELRLESTPHRGTTATLSLPEAPPPG